MTHKYRVVHPQGKVQVFTLSKPAPLELLQGWVGGFVEFVRGETYDRSGLTLVVNEDGILRKLMPNHAYPLNLVGPVVEGKMKGPVFAGYNT